MCQYQPIFNIHCRLAIHLFLALTCAYDPLSNPITQAALCVEGRKRNWLVIGSSVVPIHLYYVTDYKYDEPRNSPIVLMTIGVKIGNRLVRRWRAV